MLQTGIAYRNSRKCVLSRQLKILYPYELGKHCSE